MRKCSAMFALLLLVGGAVAPDLASAANWPRFRGPNGTGIASDKDVPTEFSDTKNVLWKTAIPGAGYSSPVVWDDRIFLESSSADGKTRSLVCLDAANKGKILWSKPISGDAAKIHKKNSFASSTPATDGQRVYASFWDGSNVFLYAFDFAGKQLWKQDLGAFKSQHGHGQSPMIVGDKVIYNHDQDGAAVLLAFNAKDGTAAWQKRRDPFRSCYSTPFVQEKENGKTELICASTAGITSYDPATGAENWNWAWKFAGMPPQRTVGSPIAAGGLVFISSGDGAGTRHMVAVTADGKPSVSWEKKKVFPYVPTMLAHDDHLYFVNDGGIAACYSVKDGKEMWNERIGGGFSASPVLIDGKVYAPAEDGSVYVFPAKPQFEKPIRNAMNEEIMASPAVADGKLYIRGKTNLFCIGKK